MGVMNNFRHLLMGHEIFFKVFTGPQNIFSCSIFVILFFKSRGLQHKISTLVIKEIQERLDMLNKSQSLSRHNASNGKNKAKCLMHFDLGARVFVISN